MNKLLLTLSFLISFNFLSTLVLAEVNIDLLKQKYPKCEDNSYRHECFDILLYSKTKKVGYFRDNSLWDGLTYQNDILIFEHINGKQIGKSSCEKSITGWYNCPSGTRYKSIENGFVDSNGNRQGKFRIEFISGNLYVGNYKNNRINGYGIFTWANGEKYTGQWKDDKIYGQGKYIFNDGNIKEGIWKNGKFMYAKKSTPTSNSKIEEYKSFCSEIGFTPGTEKFGECVVEAMKKG